MPLPGTPPGHSRTRSSHLKSPTKPARKISPRGWRSCRLLGGRHRRGTHGWPRRARRAERPRERAGKSANLCDDVRPRCGGFRCECGHGFRHSSTRDSKGKSPPVARPGDRRAAPVLPRTRSGGIGRNARSLHRLRAGGWAAARLSVSG